MVHKTYFQIEDQKEFINIDESKLINILKKMYETAANKEQVSSIHLFGIKFARELNGKNLKNIALKATGKESYQTEINKGMRLRYLLEKDGFFSGIQKIDTKPTESVGVWIKSRNFILYGPPGVGKTYNYKRFIDFIERGNSEREIFDEISSNSLYDQPKFDDDLNDRIRFVTFHQNFDYEDFVEGFRPDAEGKIVLTKGIFREIIEKAQEDTEHNYYLVIDEINRGNISKIFGELITLIEVDKRGTLEVTLPYSKEPFSVPKNLYIIGTMNSTDKSIALIDIALRRRFTFLKMEPKAELIEYSKAREIFERLNVFITERIGEEFRIGHSYFMPVNDNDTLDFVLKYKITPLLEEYFYGDRSGLEEALKIINNP